MKRIIVSFTSSNGLPNWWEPVYLASGSKSVFLSPAWLETWIDIYGREFEGSWIRWEAADRVVAGCLLVRRVVWINHIPFHSVYFNATGEARQPTPLAEFNDVLIVRGHEAAVAESLASLLTGTAWSRLLLAGHLPDSTLDGILKFLGTDHVERFSKPSHYVDLIALGGRPFITSLTGQAGTQVRRNLREYENRLGAMTVRRAADLPEALAYFSEMRKLHLARWNQRQQTTSLSFDAVVDFHHRLIEALLITGEVDLLRVGSETHAIGYLYTFPIRGKVSFFQSGFAYEPSSKWSPGMLTHALVIEHYRSNGLAEYDFLSGEAQYKRTLSNGTRHLRWTTVFRDRLWIRLALSARRLKQRLFSVKMIGQESLQLSDGAAQDRG